MDVVVFLLDFFRTFAIFLARHRPVIVVKEQRISFDTERSFLAGNNASAFDVSF